MVVEKYTFLQMALWIAAFNWVTVLLKWKTIDRITRPAVMIALLAFIWNLRSGLLVHGNINWLFLALLFALIGDLLFILLGTLSLPGLIALSLTYVAYGLSLHTSPPINLPSLMVLLMVGITMLQVCQRILTEQHSFRERFQIIGYLIITSGMAFFALLTLVSNGWENYRALLVSAGAVLLLLSAVWMIWDRYVEPISFGDLRTRITYHAGHCLLCLGFLMTF